MTIGVKYTHGLPFNAQGVLGAAGLSPVDPRYASLVSIAEESIYEEVLGAAVKLKYALINEVVTVMNMIDEYENHPQYMQVAQQAMKKTLATVEWRRGVAHAKFVDFESLGDLTDLVEIQRAIVPQAGSPAAWKRMYQAGRVEGVIAARLNLMSAYSCAPFLVLVEEGNTQSGRAYPEHGPTNVFAGFKENYTEIMRAAFMTVVAAMRALLTSQRFYVPEESYIIAGTERKGYLFETSIKGERVFVEHTRVVSLGGTKTALYGSGWTFKGLDASGKAIWRSFSGFIPKIR
jgi:hypothetical protein